MLTDTHKCVCTYTHTQILCSHTGAFQNTNIRTHTDTYLHAHIHKNTCMDAHTYILCPHIGTFQNMRSHAHKSTYTHIYTCTQKHIHRYTHTYPSPRTDAFQNMRARSHIHTHTQRHILCPPNVCSEIHTYKFFHLVHCTVYAVLVTTCESDVSIVCWKIIYIYIYI